jgi:hypothetical protein
MGGMSRSYGFDLAKISFYYELRIESLCDRQMYRLSFNSIQIILRDIER